MENHKPVVLIADQISEDVIFAISLLRKNNCQVELAVDGETALILATTSPPDLILLDSSFPVIDGCETCLWLKKQQNLANVPVIVLTNKKKTSSLRTWAKLGAVGYLTKPLNPSSLLVQVKKYLYLK